MRHKNKFYDNLAINQIVIKFVKHSAWGRKGDRPMSVYSFVHTLKASPQNINTNNYVLIF